MTPGYTHTFLGFLLRPHCRERSAFLTDGICSHPSRGSLWAVPRPRDAPGSLPPSPNTSHALTTSGREGHCLHHIPAADLGCFQLLYRFRAQTGLVLILTVLEENSFWEPEGPRAEFNPVPSLSSMGFEEGTIPQPWDEAKPVQHHGQRHRAAWVWSRLLCRSLDPFGSCSMGRHTVFPVQGNLPPRAWGEEEGLAQRPPEGFTMHSCFYTELLRPLAVPCPAGLIHPP